MPTDIDVVLVDLDERIDAASAGVKTDIEAAESVEAKISSAERRVRALSEAIGTSDEQVARLSAVPPEPPQGLLSEDPDLDWAELVAEARQRVRTSGKEDAAIDDLISDNDVRDIERRLGGDFRIKTRLDRYDVAAMVLAGVVAGLVDFFFVRIPHDMTYPLGSGLAQEGSPLTKWLRDLKVPDDNALAGLAKVAYDRVNLTGTGQEVAGLGPRTHRYHTLGHDPLLGFVFGVIDIQHGSMTAIDKTGQLKYIPGLAPPKKNPLEALTLQCVHSLSDVCTPMGIPAPAWTALGAAQFGSIGPKNRTVAEVSRWMYLNGYDLRHFLTQTLSVAAAELILHLYWFVREALDDDWAATVEREWAQRDLTSSLDDRGVVRRLGAHPRYEALALGTHALGAAANAGKIALSQGNPLALNYAQWARFFQASFRFSRRFFAPPGKNVINAVWLNEVALAGGWPTLDWTLPDAPQPDPET